LIKLSSIFHPILQFFIGSASSRAVGTAAHWSSATIKLPGSGISIGQFVQFTLYLGLSHLADDRLGCVINIFSAPWLRWAA